MMTGVVSSVLFGMASLPQVLAVGGGLVAAALAGLDQRRHHHAHRPSVLRGDAREHADRVRTRAVHHSRQHPLRYPTVTEVPRRGLHRGARSLAFPRGRARRGERARTGTRRASVHAVWAARVHDRKQPRGGASIGHRHPASRRRMSRHLRNLCGRCGHAQHRAAGQRSELWTRRHAPRQRGGGGARRHLTLRRRRAASKTRSWGC